MLFLLKGQSKGASSQNKSNCLKGEREREILREIIKFRLLVAQLECVCVCVFVVLIWPSSPKERAQRTDGDGDNSLLKLAFLLLEWAPAKEQIGELLTMSFVSSIAGKP